MTSSVTEPVRTCIGCRGRSSRSSLVRVTYDHRAAVPTAVVDIAKSAPGRGAWLHMSDACLDRAIAHRAVARALRQSIPIDCSPVQEWFGENITPNRWSSIKRAGQKPMGTR